MQSETRKRVLVTGGTGALGTEVCKTFLAQNAKVVATYLYDEEADRFKAALRDEASKVHLVQADLSHVKDAQDAIDLCVLRMGGLDTLCNVAGGFDMGEFMTFSAGALEQQLSMNFRSGYFATQAAVSHLIERGGKVVFVGSRAVIRGGSQMVAYAASKAAVHSMCQSLAEELKPHNIQVNTVVPSIIDTPENRESMPDVDPSNWVAPADIAKVISFLCSSDADCITGAILPVYGRA